jgi:Flp pilus assembly protein TadG
MTINHPTHPLAAALRLARRLSPARRSGHGSESGQATVELAIVLPILVLLLVAMVDLGRAYNYWIDATHLANEGARLAAVGKSPCSALDNASANDLKSGGSRAVPDPAQSGSR